MQISINKARIKKNVKNHEKIKYFCPILVIVSSRLSLLSKTTLYILSFIAFAGLFYSCSTEKNSIINKTYHNTTSRYNGYFNAKESVNEGLEKIKENYVENYTELLPVFIEGDDAAARSVYPNMDKAIEKCTDVIQRHSMYIKEVEYCKWIDNSYLLIGIANYYKKDYRAANEMFDFVSKEYEENKEKYVALMWMAKSYTGLKNYSKATSVLNEASSYGKFTNREKANLKAIRADMYIQQKNYAAGASALSEAVNLTKNKEKKARLTYIIAQLYQLQNNPSQASHYFAEVVKLNPKYELAFYAKINRALSYEKGSGNLAEIKEELNKMLKDEKNKEYFDQIYFALAELELKQGNKPEGIALLEQSAKESKNNAIQKTRTHLKLAKLYFEDKDYINAQSNYDSTVTYMDKNREDYLDILDMRNGLTRIVKDILIVEREDSLQHLASLPRKDVDKIIGEIIDEIIDEENRVKQEQLNTQQSLMSQNQNMNMNMNKGGGWYFYNPSTVSYGKTEFAKRWGQRKLEDNWRRKDKSSGTSFADEMELEQIEDEDTLANANDIKSPNYYFKNIPNNDKKMKASHDAIIEALYDLGVQYKEELEDFNEARDAFENLIERYDTSKYHLNSYYQLYRLYLDSDKSKSDFYKNIILSNYKNTEYAKLLINPNYFNEINAEQSKVENLYETALAQYTSKNYIGVLTNVNEVKTKHNKNELIPKFLYLEGLAYSSINDTSKLKKTLTTLKDNYGSTPEGELAKAALLKLESGNKPSSSTTSDEEESNYTFKADQKHNFILIMPVSVMKDAEVKKALSDFNAKYYRKSDLKISSVLFGTDQRMYVVKDYNNIFSAMDYYNTFRENGEELRMINSVLVNSFVISTDNYPPFYKEKDITGYEMFFIKKYKN